jgi:hypothetical protein
VTILRPERPELRVSRTTALVVTLTADRPAPTLQRGVSEAQGLVAPGEPDPPDDRNAAREQYLRDGRLDAARANTQWVELQIDDLEPRGRRLVADRASGLLYEWMVAPVFPYGNPDVVENAALVAGYVVDATGEPRFLGWPGSGQPRTVAELEQRARRSA